MDVVITVVVVVVVVEVVVAAVVVVVVIVVVGFGVVLGRGVALGGEEVEGVPGKEIKWASWIILLISNIVFLALVKKNMNEMVELSIFMRIWCQEPLKLHLR